MCDFCENIKIYDEYGNHWFSDGVLYNPKEKEYCLAQNDSEYDFDDYLDVKFCPLCGRKLSEEAEKPNIDEIAEILKEELTADEYLKLKENAKMFSDAVDGLWKILNKGFHDD